MVWPQKKEVLNPDTGKAVEAGKKRGWFRHAERFGHAEKDRSPHLEGNDGADKKVVAGETETLGQTVHLLPPKS